MSTGSSIDPHDKMRARDISKVARGEQAPRPPQQSPPVSRAPPPSSTTTPQDKKDAEIKRSSESNDQMRRCYDSYHEYHKCIEEKGIEAEACKKVADYYKSSCPEWTSRKPPLKRSTICAFFNVLECHR